MWVWIWVSSRDGRGRQPEAVAPPSRGTRPSGRARSGSPSRIAGSSTWMISTPAASRSTTSSRIASASCLHVSERGWSSRTNDHISIVTGPVSMPFTGLSVSDWAYLIQSTVIAFGPRDVAEEDRRPHVARAVGLHPGVLGEHVAVHLLGEVLDHVVALGLAVHEHVEADLLLEPDHALDLAAHQVEVLLLVDLALAQPHARLADLGRLRERADRRRREERQAEPLALRLAAFGEGALRGGRRRRSTCRQPLAHLRDCGCAARCGGPRAPCGWRRARRRSRSLALVQRLASSAATSSSFWTANDIQLSTSSSRFGSLRLSIGECSSEQEVETTSSLAGQRPQLLQQREAALEVVDPDVAADHDAREQRLALGPAVLGDQVEVPLAAHEVEADALDRQPARAPGTPRRRGRSRC